MPSFDFKCEQCERIFERIVRASQCNLNQPCPDCGGVSKREVSAAAFTISGYSAANGYSEEK